jgi:hypothetical protein
MKEKKIILQKNKNSSFFVQGNELVEHRNEKVN